MKLHSNCNTKLKGGKIFMRNKKAMGGLAIALIVFGILALSGSVLWLGGAFEQKATADGVVTDIGDCADASGILTANVVSALAKGTAVGSPTITAGVNGGTVSTSVTSGTTTFPVGANVEVLVSKADYIDEVFSFVMPCGGQTLEAPVYYATSDNPSIRAKNDDGDYMTDTTSTPAGTNQTAVGVGEVIKWDIEFSGTSLESSGDGILIVEFPASTSANITKVELSGATLTSLPTIHSSVNAGSKIVAFEIPAVVGSDKSVHTLTITLGASKDLVGTTLMDWYAKQKFVDTDGSIAFGVEDSEGTAKYENTMDYDVLTE
jgi:hypothetical protein